MNIDKITITLENMKEDIDYIKKETFLYNLRRLNWQTLFFLRKYLRELWGAIYVSR